MQSFTLHEQAMLQSWKDRRKITDPILYLENIGVARTSTEEALLTKLKSNREERKQKRNA